jgi:hypothetical protein
LAIHIFSFTGAVKLRLAIVYRFRNALILIVTSKSGRAVMLLCALSTSVVTSTSTKGLLSKSTFSNTFKLELTSGAQFMSVAFNANVVDTSISSAMLVKHALDTLVFLANTVGAVVIESALSAELVDAGVCDRAVFVV